MAGMDRGGSGVILEQAVIAVATVYSSKRHLPVRGSGIAATAVLIALGLECPAVSRVVSPF